MTEVKVKSCCGVGEGVVDSFEEELFELGLEGWKKVFPVKRAEGYSQRREFHVQRHRSVRDPPCLRLPWSDSAGGWVSGGPDCRRLCAMLGGVGI